MQSPQCFHTAENKFPKIEWFSLLESNYHQPKWFKTLLFIVSYTLQPILHECQQLLKFPELWAGSSKKEKETPKSLASLLSFVIRCH